RWTLNVFFVMSNNARALLIVGHGSTVNPDSSAPTLAHAAEIRRRKVFVDVECAFWKEEPSLRDAIFLFDPKAAREVYVVPNFISEGYFTQTVIPRELELDGRSTKRPNGQVWKYCEPVGNHPLVTELLLQRAREIAPGVPETETSLLIVAHGTDLNENSAAAAKREAEKIRALGKYADVLNVYMEEAPLVAGWRKLTKSPNVVVVPFFISDGLHSYEDIPVLLGIAKERSTSNRISAGGEIFQRNPYKIDNRSLFYAPSIGTDPRFADIIVAQVNLFDDAFSGIILAQTENFDSKSSNPARACFVLNQITLPHEHDEDDHVQRLASDRGVRFGGRLHEEPNQAGGANDPRGPQLPVGRHLQNREKGICHRVRNRGRAAGISAIPDHARTLRRGFGNGQTDHRGRCTQRPTVFADVSHHALGDYRADDEQS